MRAIGWKQGWLGAVLLIATFVATAPLLPTRAQQTRVTTPDSAHVRAFLNGVRGGNPLLCELAIYTLDGWYGWRRVERAPDAFDVSYDLTQWALRRIDDPTAIAPLRTALEDRDPCVRRSAARLLGRMRHRQGVESLLSALQSRDAQLREMAAVGLGYAQDHEALSPLLGALEDGTGPVRAAAAWALGRLEARTAVDPLVRTLRDDPDARVRRAAAWALGAMH